METREGDLHGRRREKIPPGTKSRKSQKVDRSIKDKVQMQILMIIYLIVFTLSYLYCTLLKMWINKAYQHQIDKKLLLCYATHDTWLDFKKMKTGIDSRNGVKLVDKNKRANGKPLVTLIDELEDD